MRLIEFEVENFRSLKHINWKPGSLNVLVGANGVGKSNVLRALDLLSNSARMNLDRHVRYEGGMHGLFWDSQGDEMSMRILTSPIDRDRDPERDSLTYILGLGRLGANNFRVETELLGNFYRVKTGERSEPLKLLERNTRHAVIFDEAQRALVPQESVNDGESLLSGARGPYQVNRLVAAYQRQVSRWAVYSDFQTHRHARVRKSISARRDLKLASDGHNLVNVLHTLCSENREFRDEIHRAMSEAFGEDFQELVFAPVMDNQIELRIRWKSLNREQGPSDISDGTFRFLWLLTILGAQKRPSLIAVDEPEYGLHPAMMPIIVDFAEKAAESSQLIFATTAPHFLDCFGENVTVTAVDRVGGETQLNVLESDEVEDWLEKYSLEGPAYDESDKAEASEEAEG